MKKLVRLWHEFWYAYHWRSAAVFQGRFDTGWGNHEDARLYDVHLRKALFHRAKAQGIAP